MFRYFKHYKHLSYKTSIIRPFSEFTRLLKSIKKPNAISTPVKLPKLNNNNDNTLPMNQELSYYSSQFTYESTIKNKDYNNLASIILSFKNYYHQHTPEQHSNNLMSQIQYFLEHNLSHFPLDLLFKLSIECITSKTFDLHFYYLLQNHMGKRILNDPILRKNDETISMLLYLYFKITAENSLMDVPILHNVLDYFINKSSLLKDPKNLFDFIWLTSLSIASIIETRKYYLLDPYIKDINSQVLDFQATKNLHVLLNKAETMIINDDNYSENGSYKVRLYKAIYYLRGEGIHISPQLNSFLEKFKPYVQINMTHSSNSPSILEDTLEKILKGLNLAYERNKLLNFGTVDFFIKPDICIEVNGPSHYFMDIPVAKDIMKRRALVNDTYTLYPVSYKNFNNLDALQSDIYHRFLHVHKHLNKVAEIQLSQQLHIDPHRPYRISPGPTIHDSSIELVQKIYDHMKDYTKDKKVARSIKDRNK